MEPKTGMYIFVNKGLGMSSGKMAAQAAHAAVEAYKVSNKDLIKQWELGKHYAKLVMQARDERHLMTIQKYLADRGIKSELIIDEGMTEIDAHQATALGVEILDRNDPSVQATMSTFELYRDAVKVILEFNR
jgi:PTH2 family peptidyl-tRNA hydrolase